MINETDKENIILFVDDNSTFLEFIKYIIPQKINARIACFSNPLSAIDFIIENKEKIIVIVLDMVMPECNGVEFIKKIKISVDKKIPFIILTGVEPSHEDVKVLLQLGIHDIVNKMDVAESKDYEVLKNRLIRQIEIYNTNYLLSKEKENLNSILNESSSLTALITHEEKIIECNESFRSQFGIKHDDITISKVYDTLSNESISKIKLSMGKGIKSRFTVKSGTDKDYKWFEIEICKINNNFLIQMKDVTRKKKKEMAFRNALGKL